MGNPIETDATPPTHQNPKLYTLPFGTPNDVCAEKTWVGWYKEGVGKGSVGAYGWGIHLVRTLFSEEVKEEEEEEEREKERQRERKGGRRRQGQEIEQCRRCSRRPREERERVDRMKFRQLRAQEGMLIRSRQDWG
eukprot:766685-Hanusia_phi.AAC.1